MKPSPYHKYLQGKILEHSEGNTINQNVLVERYLVHARIPKKIIQEILEEMEMLGLIRINENKRIQVVGCSISQDLKNYTRKTRRKMIIRNI